MTDVLIGSLGHPVFTWSEQQDLSRPGSPRSAYLMAIKEADRSHYEPHLTFARS